MKRLPAQISPVCLTSTSPARVARATPNHCGRRSRFASQARVSARADEGVIDKRVEPLLQHREQRLLTHRGDRASGHPLVKAGRERRHHRLLEPGRGLAIVGRDLGKRGSRAKLGTKLLKGEADIPRAEADETGPQTAEFQTRDRVTDGHQLVEPRAGLGKQCLLLPVRYLAGRDRLVESTPGGAENRLFEAAGRAGVLGRDLGERLAARQVTAKLLGGDAKAIYKTKDLNGEPKKRKKVVVRLD